MIRKKGHRRGQTGGGTIRLHADALWRVRKTWLTSYERRAASACARSRARVCLCTCIRT